MELSRMISVLVLAFGVSLCLSRTSYLANPYCVKDCSNFIDGNYQSCLGCNVYASCVNGYLIDNRSCPNLDSMWDDLKKRCYYNSSTCETPKCGTYEDVNKMEQCVCSAGKRRQNGTCVADCGHEVSYGNTFIKYPEQAVRCAQKIFFFTPYLKNCLSACRSNILCRSVSYFSFGLCYHSPCDQKRNFLGPQRPKFYRDIQGVTLYIRNCE